MAPPLSPLPADVAGIAAPGGSHTVEFAALAIWRVGVTRSGVGLTAIRGAPEISPRRALHARVATCALVCVPWRARTPRAAVALAIGDDAVAQLRASKV